MAFRPDTWSRRTTHLRCCRPPWSPRSHWWPPARHVGPDAEDAAFARQIGAARARRPAPRGDRSAPSCPRRPHPPAHRPTRSAPDTRTPPTGSTRVDPPTAAPRHDADPHARAQNPAARTSRPLRQAPRPQHQDPRPRQTVEPVDTFLVTDVALGVVMNHPPIQCRLQLTDRGEYPVGVGEELRPHLLMKALNLSRRGGRPRRGQQMPDPVLHTHPIKQHLRRRTTRTEPPREHLPVIGQDLLRHPVALQSTQQRITHRSCRRPRDNLGRHHKPGVVINPSHHLYSAPSHR